MTLFSQPQQTGSEQHPHQDQVEHYPRRRREPLHRRDPEAEAGERSSSRGDGEGVVVTQVVPLPDDINIPLVARYQRALKANPNAEPGFVSLEGSDHLLTKPGQAQRAGRIISAWADQYLVD